jgi:hypothetical protein
MRIMKEEVPVLRKQGPPFALVFFGAITGISYFIDFLVRYEVNMRPSVIGFSTILAAFVTAYIFFGTQKMLRRVICRSMLTDSAEKRYLKFDTLTYSVFILSTLGAFGLYLPFSILIILFLLFQSLLLVLLLNQEEKKMLFSSLGWLSFLFLISGFAALIYQIAWQRVLFTIFGVNIESITIIVSIFMLGLGVGSVVGGKLSAKYPARLPQLFFACEIFIGMFGIVSIPLIQAVGMITLHGSLLTMSLTTYALLSIPTMFMGASLPILVTYLHLYYLNVGKSVGMLYSINTLGAAIACFITADVLFSLFGLQVSVFISALFNFVVGVLVYRYSKSLQRKATSKELSRYAI